MAKETETALVLPASAVVGSEAVHYGGFPGQWYPGRAIAVSALGFETEDEALEAAKDLPLVVTRVKVGSAPAPERENHVAGVPFTNALADEVAEADAPATEEATA
jgi:hypothetical protein